VSALLTFDRLKWGSFAHSVVYLGLLACAIGNGPDGLTTWLGWGHGVGWIAMTLACLAALRLRIIGLRLAVAVAVLGGVGPFFGSFEFARQARERRRASAAARADPVFHGR
jgi:hypothetical protein